MFDRGYIGEEKRRHAHGGLAVWSTGRGESADSILTHSSPLFLFPSFRASSPASLRLPFLPSSSWSSSTSQLFSLRRGSLSLFLSTSPLSFFFSFFFFFFFLLLLLQSFDTTRRTSARCTRMSHDFSQTLSPKLASLLERITYNYSKTRLHGAWERHSTLVMPSQSPVHIGPLEESRLEEEAEPRGDADARRPRTRR
ncbi:unnamed protein product [Xylocopa violacea]|uniref:Transmembrane protein n=1 Tax=Xylocopa violacea TaxID=135666 RepID=A0ABP1NTY1_XYLVO